MELTLWRAPTDNDRKIKVEWYKERYDKVHNKCYECKVEGNRITVKASLAPVARLKVFAYTATYTFFADGQIDVSLEGSFDTTRTFIPRLGFEFATREEAFRYFGYGPIESYVDMRNGAKMGMYESTAQKEYVPYIMPQEHGNHYGVKMLELGGFTFVSRQGFECNVSQYTTKELETKQHNFELEADGLNHVRVDYKVSGIGSGSCGPQLREQYRLQDETVKFEFSYKFNNQEKSTIKSEIACEAGKEHIISISANENGIISLTINYDDQFDDGGDATLYFDAATGNQVTQ
jgi:beta-galactosidase